MNPTESSPNIIFILTDQHRKQAVGAYGAGLADTPCLDGFAADGITFSNAYTTCAICSPARASLQTGYYPFRHGMRSNIFMPGAMIHELADSPGLLSRRLGKAGYYPALTGKWHLGFGRETFRDPAYMENYRNFDAHLADIEYPPYYRSGSGLPTALGYHGDDFPGHGGGGQHYPRFRDYLRRNGLEHEVRLAGRSYGVVTSPVESTVDYFLTSRGIDLIEDGRRSGKPFFLMLNYWGPHEPEFVPEEYFERYQDRNYQPWPSFSADQSRKPRFHEAARSGLPWSAFEERLRYSMAYASFVDEQIGRVLRHLRQNDLYDESLIIFSADHGDSMGIHGGLVDKAIFMYEDTVSVPMIIKPPASWTAERQSGTRDTRMVNLTDLYATILDAAGLPRPVAEERHGRSLVPALVGESTQDWPEVAVTEGSGIGHLLLSQRMIRRGCHKYVFNAGDLDELYDLGNDPHEIENRAKDPEFRGILTEMQDRLDAWMRERHDGLAGVFRKMISR